MKVKNTLFLYAFIFITIVFKNAQAQTILLGPQQFNTDIIVHGSTAPTNVWFAPDYNTPIDFLATGGCDDGYAGYSGSWNNYWANFLRTPQLNCAGYDSVIMSFDLSNSYSSTHSNDKVYFNMWLEGAYHNATTNQSIFFDEARNCTHFEVSFDLTPFTNKNVLFYINASCAYNDAQPYLVKFDNICIYAPLTTVQTNIHKTNQALLIFPNPASDDYIVIKFDKQIDEPINLYIYNTTNQIVYTLENITENENRIPLAHLKSGFYYVVLKTKDKVMARDKLFVIK